MSRRHQQGIALITVMLILALVTITAVSMASRLQLDIHRSANVLNYEQAFQYVLGAEDWAKQILLRDLNENKTDSLDDDWTTVLPALPIEGGQMTGQIEDLQACFNLNNLVLNGKRQTFQYDRFRRLLDNVGLNANLADVIVDWLDADINVLTGGAEDNEYLNYSPAYRTANRYMSDVSELLLIKDIDYKIYQQLLVHVCVIAADTTINVNTASAEVISSIVNGVRIEDAQTLIEDRNQKIFTNLDEFFNHAVFQGKSQGKPINRDGVSVSSEFFRLNSAVQIDRIQVQFVTHLQRNTNGSVKVIKRSRGVL